MTKRTNKHYPTVLFASTSPKSTDLSPHSQERLNEVATQLNERPRKALKFKTPSHMIEKSVAMIG